MEKIELTHLVTPKADREMEFHVSAAARKKYDFDQEIFSITGNLIIPNIYGARVLAEKINSVENRGVKASDIFAMGLIDEILHFVLAEHRSHTSPTMFKEILSYMKDRIGEAHLDKALLTFVKEFPGSTVIKGKESPKEFLNSFNTNGISFKEIILEEMLLLHLANINPAFEPFQEFFDDSPLRKKSKYSDLINGCISKMSSISSMDVGPSSKGMSLYDLLRAPALEHPNSLTDQLKFIMEHWGVIISDFNLRMLKAFDSISEENKSSYSGPGQTHTQTYEHIEEDIENFSMDKHWMPNVMLIAKSTMVWLDQLSKKYKQKIDTLCKIPDEELDMLASRGFNGLWLIGLWNRSEASKKIKQKCGNPEAEASAYSLYNYDINQGLGGWSGIDDLK